MSGRRALLVWYPRSWRKRYGDELLAMVEDGGDRSWRTRVDIVRGGLRERARHLVAGAAAGASSDEARRAGVRAVLVGWAVTVLAGGAFAKEAEHWQNALPVGDRLVPAIAFGAVVAVAVVGAVGTVVGLLAAIPAIGGAGPVGLWRSVRGRVVVAGAVTVAMSVAFVSLLSVAHGLRPAQRAVGAGGEAEVFVAWGVLVAATIGTWAFAAIGVERRLEPSAVLVRTWSAVALVVAAAMVVFTASIGTWWWSMAVHAPRFLGGGTTAVWTWHLVVIGGMALGGATIGAWGAWRIRSGARLEHRARHAG